MGTKYIIDVDELARDEEAASATIYMQSEDNGTNEKKDRRGNGKPYAFWVSDRAVIEMWKRYFEVTGRNVGESITNAINEYIDKNPITQDQKNAYNEKLMKMFMCDKDEVK